MAMTKIVPPDAWPWDEEPVRHVKVAAAGLRGSDLTALVKRAGSPVATWVRNHPPAPGEVMAHVLALASTEAVGFNKNADGYTAKALEKYAHTFLNAHAYREHNSKADAPIYGKPVHSWYNPTMQRVELVVAYNATKAAAARFGARGRIADAEVDALEKGAAFPVSQATRVPGDRCCAEGTLVETDKDLVPIEQIAVGDRVLTHTGKFQRVTRLWRNQHDGSDGVKIAVSGLPEAPVLTGNHPVYVVRREKLRGCNGRAARHTPVDADQSVCRVCRKTFDATPQWVEAADVRVGDYVVNPAGRRGTDARMSLTKSYMLGAYVGDGCAIYQGRFRSKKGPKVLCAVSYTLDTSRWQQLITRFQGNAAVLLGRTTTVKKSGSGRRAARIDMYGRDLSAEFVAACGEKCRGKRVGARVFAAASEQRAAFLAGLVDTDGCVSGDVVRVASVSPILARQTQRLAWSLGMPARVQKQTLTGGYTPGVVCYQTHIPYSFAFPTIGGHSTKLASTGAKTTCRPRSNSVCCAGHMLSPVTAVDRVPLTGAVYNLSVEEDETYNVGFVVHNCTLCDHWSRTRADYCTEETCKYAGCRHHLGRVYDDGVVQAVDNPVLNFFDLSRVSRGADRTAFALAKLAGAYTIGGAELAEQLGVETPNWLVDDVPGHLLPYVKLARTLAAREAGLNGPGLPPASVLRPEDAVEKWSAERRHQCLSALAAKGAVAPLADWLRLTTGRDGAACAKAAAAVGVPRYADIVEGDEWTAALEKARLAAVVPQAVVKWAAVRAPAAALTPAAVQERVWLATLRGEPAVKRAGTAATAPAALAVAARYLAYQTCALAAHENSLQFPLLADAALRQNRGL